MPKLIKDKALELELKRTPSSKTEYQKQEAKLKNIDLKFLITQNDCPSEKVVKVKVESAKTKLNLATFDVNIIKEKLSMAEIRAPKDGVF